MSTKVEVKVEQGPDEGENHIGSIVVRAPSKSFWVSTVDLGRLPRRYETLVFPIPNGVELVTNSEGKPEFSQDFDLYEGRSGDQPGISNTTNIPNSWTAHDIHRNAVSKLAHALAGK